MTHELTSLAFKELGAASIRGSKSYSLASRHVGQTFIIDVAQPAKPIPPDQPIPVVFVLDGDAVFGIVAQTSLYLQLDPGGLPPLLGPDCISGEGPGRVERHLGNSHELGLCCSTCLALLFVTSASPTMAGL